MPAIASRSGDLRRHAHRCQQIELEEAAEEGDRRHGGGGGGDRCRGRRWGGEADIEWGGEFKVRKEEVGTKRGRRVGTEGGGGQ